MGTKKALSKGTKEGECKCKGKALGLAGLTLSIQHPHSCGWLKLVLHPHARASFSSAFSSSHFFSFRYFFFSFFFILYFFVFTINKKTKGHDDVTSHWRPRAY